MNKLRASLMVWMSAALVASCIQNGDEGGQGGADLVLTGARVFTSNDQQPWAEALAVKDGVFVYVGESDGALRYQADDTRSVELDGQLVIPGLIDAHAHPGYIDVELYGEISATAEEDLLAAVKAYADANPDDEWLRLCCWPIDLYVTGNQGPAKEVLDAVIPDRPVWFVSEWWHSGWLNSKALDVLGVDKNTPDPKPGVAMFMRNENREPTGWVKEGAGWQLFAEHFPIAEEAHKNIHRNSVVSALQLLSELGVTTLYDAGNFGFEDLVFGYLADLEREGKLPVRYEGTYQVFTPERRHSAVSEMQRYRRAYGGDRLQFNTVKLFMDGIYQNRSSALLEAYTDDSAYVGDTILSAEELRDFLLELNEERFDIHIHVEGDLAVRRALDAVEMARNLAGDDFYTRVTLSHLGLIDPEDLPRFRELGIIANYTPWWFTTEDNDPVRQSMGDMRFERMFDPKSLVDIGVDVTLSSDEWWGGELLQTYLSPYFGMQIAHTRKYPREWRDIEEVAKPPLDGQLSIDQIIMGYTRNAAYQLRREDAIGSIETGKLADFLVLDENLFETNTDEIWKRRPTAVIMEGKIIQGQLPD